MNRKREARAPAVLRRLLLAILVVSAGWPGGAVAETIAILGSTISRFVSPTTRSPAADRTVQGALELMSDGAYRGSRKVAGLGFYLDSATRMTRTDTMESGIGFLGVFANFQPPLINLKTSTVEAHERIVAGATFPAAMAPDRTPWNALNATRKSEELDSLMKREIERVLPLMLSQTRK